MKNRVIIYTTGLVTLIFWLFVTGCSTSVDEDISDKNGFQFCVQIPKALEVETKASLGGGDEKIDIKDAWIVQYASPGNNLLHCVYINSGFTTENTGYTVTITTKNDQFSLVSSSFYVILNGGAELLKDFESASDNSKEALLKKICAAPSNVDGSPAITSVPILLTAGPTEYTVTGEAEKVIVISRVYRAFAKLSLSVTFPTIANDIFVVESATVTNIPKNMALFAGGGSKTPYPELSTMYTSSISIKDIVVNGGKQSFYMPENIRGTGSSLTFQGKNQVANGPDGNLNGCTYLTIKGKYYYDKTQAPGGGYIQTPIDVEYRFYLGSNLTNDYNIRRDHHYNLTVNITGANSADLRVTITNGNVAVFDKVQEITNEVDF